MDATPEPPEPDEEAVVAAKGCPNDTDGDGNCGRPACPHCGPHGRRHSPQQDLSDTPTPVRAVDEY